MEDDILPIFGHFEGNGDDSSDSDNEEADHILDVDEAHDEEEHSEHDATDDEDEEEERPPQGTSNITFDKSLPGTHSYLGNDLEDVRGRTIHDDDSCITLPLLSLPGVVLCPGQTIPLHLYRPNVVAMMQRVLEDDKTFGLITSRFSLGMESDQSLANVGTTAEVLAFKVEEDEGSGIRNAKVKAIGRQRFRINETRRSIDGIIMGHVNILPEYVLPDPLEGIRPCIHTRPSASNKNKKVTRLSSATLTHWPPWVYQQYDAATLMRRVKAELLSWNDTLREDMMPSDVIEFSYWLATNLPLDDTLKFRLLWINNAVQRLRCELSIMQRCTALCCRECNVLIANKNDVFSMALEGPMGAYVNPGGFVHETLTVTKAQNLELIGRASTENSWFPGYAWTILQCHGCSQHMGWKFTASKRSLRPQKFWGLTRSGLMPGLQQDPQGAGEGQEELWQPVM